MKPTRHTRSIAVVTLFAVLATACATTDADPTAGDGTAPMTVPIDTTVPVASTDVERLSDVPPSMPATDTEPPIDPVAAVDPDDRVDGVVVTIDEIGVSTVLPNGWTPSPGGGFTDGTSQLSAFAIATAEAGDDALDGFELLGEVTAGGRVWELHTQPTGEMLVGVAFTEIGDYVYGLVLEAAAAGAELLLETVVVPALAAFEVTDVPVGSGPSGNRGTDGVDIDGRTVAYHAAGTGDGTPTVVFEAGLGAMAWRAGRS